MECRYVELGEVVLLYTELTDDQDPEFDFRALENAVRRPREGSPGYDLYPDLDHKAAALFEVLYPDLDHKAAALFEELILRRPFPRRNGMVAALATYTFYGLNGCELAISDSELVQLGERVERGEAGTTAIIAVRFGHFSRPLPDPPSDE